MTNKIESTIQDRESKYGSFNDNAKITQMLVDTLKLGTNYKKLSKQHVEAFHMIFHKMSRCVCGDPYYIDNIHDIVGYARLLETYLLERQEDDIRNN